MNVSRFWGAALAWGAFLASSTSYAQFPYPANPALYPSNSSPQQYYYSPGYAQPQPGVAALGTPVIPTNRQGWQAPTSQYGSQYGSQPNWTHERPANFPVQAYPVSTYPVSAQGPQSVITGGNGISGSPNDGPIQAPQAGPYTGELPYPNQGRAMPSYPAPGYPGPTSGYPGPTSGYYGGGMSYGEGVPYGAGNYSPPNGAYGNGYFGDDQSYAGMGGVGYGGGGSCGAGGGGIGAMPWDMSGGYGGDQSCYAPRPSLWYAGAYGMMLTTDRRSHFTFSFDDANEASQFTDSRDAHMDWNGGFAVTVGRYFNCGRCALEFVYWGWFPDDVAVYTFAGNVAGNLNGIFNWNSLNYNGATADTWVDNAQVHALFRSSEIQNVELNVLHFGTGCGSPAQFSLVGGFRYFRFRDQLTFASDTTDGVIDGDISEIFYNIRTENELFGVQIGGVGSYCMTPRFVLNGGTKFGLYENVISHTSAIYGSAGTATINNGPFTGREWIVNNQKEDVSFLGELFLGASYCVGNRWSVSGGYRAVAVTGLALPTSQIYAADLRGINDVESIESSDTTVLHGWYLGGQFCF